MSRTLASLEAFRTDWGERLSAGPAEVRIVARPLDDAPGLHFAVADALVTSLGYQPIGGNWELLDAEGGPDAPRSALAALGEAFAHDMLHPGEPWLGEREARAMGAAFLACFDAATRQIVTNRMYFGWHPLTAATAEWAFVAHDDSAIALLLAMQQG